MEIFWKKNVLNNIHEYANKLIYMFEYQLEGLHLRFNLAQTVSLYVEHRLNYD